MEKEEFIKIAEKLVEGAASEEEIARYHAYYNQYQLDYPEWDGIKPAIKLEIKTALMHRIHSRIRPKAHLTRLWPRIAVAASLLLAVLVTLFYLDHSFEPSMTSRYKNDVGPGKQTAVLVLSNGKRIDLSAVKNGTLTEEAGITVNKAGDGRLVYQVKEGKSNTGVTAYNTIETPRGGQYQVNLPDGTSVWLNASSSLRFPTRFAGESRRVELSGEGYFEVAKVSRTKGSKPGMQQERVPFLVVTKKQQVEVLGTHFNINSYADEALTKTTLLEGAVKVRELGNSKERLLAPGQQAVLKGTSLQVTAVDPEVAVAWKNGLFMFDKENLQTIMRQLSRWYNVDVVYEDGVDPDQVFAGSISKFKNVSQALEILELTKTVKFKIEGRRITVMP
ncbi:MAG TPA: FecR domain-containing protein [Pedobacter sp.]